MAGPFSLANIMQVLSTDTPEAAQQLDDLRKRAIEKYDAAMAGGRGGTGGASSRRMTPTAAGLSRTVSNASSTGSVGSSTATPAAGSAARAVPPAMGFVEAPIALSRSKSGSSGRSIASGDASAGGGSISNVSKAPANRAVGAKAQPLSTPLQAPVMAARVPGSGGTSLLKASRIRAKKKAAAAARAAARQASKQATDRRERSKSQDFYEVGDDSDYSGSDAEPAAPAKKKSRADADEGSGGAGAGAGTDGSRTKRRAAAVTAVRVAATAEAEAKVTERAGGRRARPAREVLVNRRILVKWDGEDGNPPSMYPARVVSYRPEDGMHEVVYEDDSTHSHDLDGGGVVWRFVNAASDEEDMEQPLSRSARRKRRRRADESSDGDYSEVEMPVFSSSDDDELDGAGRNGTPVRRRRGSMASSEVGSDSDV